MPLQDVIVDINVAYPAPRLGLGRPLIMTVKAGESTYTEYATIEALRVDYAVGTATEAKAAAIFEQPNRPNVVAVGTYDTAVGATNTIGAALESFYKRPWHFALVANDTQTDQVEAADFIGPKEYKFVAVQVSGDTGREALKNKPRVLLFDHDVAGEHLDAAAIGNLGSLQVGSITWKFKEVVGITPRYLNDQEMDAIDADNAIAYVVKNNKGQLSEGWLADGKFIDTLHGQDWIKTDMENEVANALSQLPKAPYDGRGIGIIEAAARTTLQRGFNNGIIGITADGLPDFTVATTTREEQTAEDRAARIYRGLSWSYAEAGAIHGVRVTGSITI